MTENAVSTASDVDELYWPRGFSNSGSNRVFHVTRDCRYVQFTDKPIADTTPRNRPRGRLCNHCTPDDVTIDDVDTLTHADRDVATDGGQPSTEIEDLDFENCRCSRYHTCDWCHANADTLRSTDRFNGGVAADE